MRARVVVITSLLAIAGCKDKSKVAGGAGGSGGSGGTAAPTVKLTETLPTVGAADVLAAADTRMPAMLVFLAEDGTLSFTAGLPATKPADPTHWATLVAKDGRATAKPADVAYLRTLRSALRAGVPLEEAVKMADEDQLAARDVPPPADDPPPPPPPEEEEEDGDDESGGTGTAMALEEGKMGRKDSDRAEGQYKMKHNDADAQLARAQAIEQARSAGILGSTALVDGRAESYGFGAGRKMPLDDPRLPQRQSDIVTQVRDDGPLPRAEALLLPAAHARATALIALLGQVPGLIAVSYQGSVRGLRLGAAVEGEVAWVPDWPPRIAGAVGADTVELEAVPDVAIKVPWPAGGGDVAALKKAFDAARAARGISDREDADVLVGPDTDVQRLVGVLTAMDLAGARVLAMGKVPAADELAKRGKRVPIAQAGQPNSVGDLDKAIIRRTIRAHLPEIEARYTKAPAAPPGPAGKVSTQFFIAPNGQVASAAGSGVSAEVADCVAAVIKGLEFPKPGGGGGVQVNYPFVFRI